MVISDQEVHQEVYQEVNLVVYQEVYQKCIRSYGDIPMHNTVTSFHKINLERTNLLFEGPLKISLLWCLAPNSVLRFITQKIRKCYSIFSRLKNGDLTQIVIIPERHVRIELRRKGTINPFGCKRCKITSSGHKKEIGIIKTVISNCSWNKPFTSLLYHFDMHRFTWLIDR